MKKQKTRKQREPLKIIEINPPTKEQAKEIIKRISEEINFQFSSHTK